MIQPTDQFERERERPRRNRIGPLRRLSGRFRPLPDYIILGVQKAGTTALHAYLEAHPSVDPALTKEIHFFDNNYHRGVSWYRAHFRPRFPGRTARVTGEASPAYFLHPHAPGRVSETTPRAKFIVLFRNPADRAYSHYQHNVRKGRESMSFSQAVDCEIERLSRGPRIDELLDDVDYFVNFYQFSYLLRGLYVSQLERWLREIPRERFLLLETADLLERPASTFARVRDFLGLANWDPEYKIHHHYAYDSIDSATRGRLVEYFAPHNEKLFEILGHDPGWNDLA